MESLLVLDRYHVSERINKCEMPLDQKYRRCTIVASSYLSKSRISNFKLDIKKKVFPLNGLHICLTSVTRAKPKEKMEFPA